MTTILQTLFIDILVIGLLIIIFLLIGLYLKDDETEEKEEQKEERKDFYLQLQNTTTSEILTFKRKEDFIKTIKQYDSIKYFLKGTEDENNEQLIKWYYPNYKRVV